LGVDIPNASIIPTAIDIEEDNISTQAPPIEFNDRSNF
jgi:hypothetical protein